MEHDQLSAAKARRRHDLGLHAAVTQALTKQLSAGRNPVSRKNRGGRKLNFAKDGRFLLKRHTREHKPAVARTETILRVPGDTQVHRRCLVYRRHTL